MNIINLDCITPRRSRQRAIKRSAITLEQFKADFLAMFGGSIDPADLSMPTPNFDPLDQVLDQRSSVPASPPFSWLGCSIRST